MELSSLQTASNIAWIALEKLAVPKTSRLTAVSVEEIENPRPHYSVEVRGAVTSTSSASDPAAGLLPEEVAVTVRLSIDIGSDLVVIRKAACLRAQMLLKTLMNADDAMPGVVSPLVAGTETVDAGA